MKPPTEFPVLFYMRSNGNPSIHVETFATREAADTAFDLAWAVDTTMEYDAHSRLRVNKLYKEKE